MSALNLTSKYFSYPANNYRYLFNKTQKVVDS